MTIGVVLLAGGCASRFGSDKRLSPLQDGRMLMLATIDNVRRAGLPLLVCLRSHDDDIEQTLLSEGVRCRKCPDSSQGMGSTLANGVAAIAGSWCGVLVGLADMPLIEPETYILVSGKLQPGEIVVPTYHNKRGHPVGFDRSYFPRLLALSGDRGARGILASNPGSIIEMELDDPGVLIDVDVPEDLRRVSRRTDEDSRVKD